jgi:uncharacterized protein YuzE
MIRNSYDPEADALSVWFGPPGVTSAETEEVAPGVMLDFDAAGTVIGVEVLYVSKCATESPAGAVPTGCGRRPSGPASATGAARAEDLATPDVSPIRVLAGQASRPHSPGPHRALDL